MKKIILLSLIGILFGACSSVSKEIVDTHTSEISLDWAGIYQGTLPSKSDVRVEVELATDLTFRKTTVHSGEKQEKIVTGSFTWNKEGNSVILTVDKHEETYFVREGSLVLLKKGETKLPKNVAKHLVLTKTED